MAVLRPFSSFDLGDVGADHGIARDQTGELFFAPAIGAGGSHRQHHVADLGVKVPNADFNVRRHVDAELASTLRGSMTTRAR